MSTRRIRARHPALACVLLAVALMLSHSARIAHTLLVRHVVCEHGELVHQERAAAAPIAAGHREGHPFATATASRSDHDHCDAASIFHCPASIDAQLGDARLLFIEARASSAGAELRAIAQLDLAPKASPPRA